MVNQSADHPTHTAEHQQKAPSYRASSQQPSPSVLQRAQPSAQPSTPSKLVNWQEYLWTPARLAAWLHEAEVSTSSNSSSSSLSNSDAGSQQQELQDSSQQLVPLHLRELLILLLQAAADAGHAQDLIWTPARLADWLAENGPPQGSDFRSSLDSAAWVEVWRACRTAQSRAGQQYVQRLPLVSSVTASMAQAALAAGSCSELSSGTLSSWSAGQEAASPDQQAELSFAEEAQPPLEETTGGAEFDVSYCRIEQQPLSEELDLQLATCLNLQQQQQEDSSVQPCQPQQQASRGPDSIGRQQPSAGTGVSADTTQPDDTTAYKQLQQQQPAATTQQQPQLLPLLKQLQQLHGASAAAQQGLRPLRSAAQQVAAKQLPSKEALPGDYDAVEHNAAWDAAGFASAAAAGAIKLGLAAAESTAAHPPCTAGGEDVGSHGAGNSLSPPATADAGLQPQPKGALQPPRFGVLMLVHEKGVTAAEAWEAWEALHGGKAVVRVHLKEGVSTAGLAGEAWVTCRQLPVRICSQWGCISLTGAILQAAASMLQQHPQLQHITLASGQDLPVSAVPRDLRPGLSLFGRFQFGRAFDDAARRAASDLLQGKLRMSAAEGAAWGNALVFHHTWMVLDRQLVLALLSKQDELVRVGAVLNERFMQPDVAVAADEFILITSAMRYGFVKQVVQKKLQPYMSAVRRQHRQHSAGSAEQAQQHQARHGRMAGGGERPAKQQRLGSKPCRGPEVNSVQHQAGANRGCSTRSRATTINNGRTVSATTSSSSSSSVPGHHSASRSSSRGRSDAPLQLRPLSAPAAANTQRPGPRSSVARSLPPSGHGSNMHATEPVRSRAAKSARGASAHGQQSHSSSIGADNSSPGTPLFEGTHGVLLDCCPTLALFHPTQTRHPHEWRNFSECLLVDVNSTRPGHHKLTFLEALALAQPNAALFFRKVAPMQRQCPAQLMGCLKLLWKGKALPPTVEELPE